MASWNNPALINKISDDVPAIKNLLLALLKMNDAGTEDVPAGAKRLYSVSGGVQFQNYTGSAWTNVGKLMHDVDMLDGKHASSSATADTIPVRDANGRLAGDILGNANTATTAASVAAGYVVPIANGGTGASDEAGARTNLGTNNAANITEGVLAIERGGTGSGTKNFVDLSTAQTIGGNKAFSGEVTLNKNVLKMTVLDTLEGATDERTDTLIQGISPNADGGITALFGASGNAVFGAGEGKDSLLAELAGNADEDVYIIADGAIHFHPNANTYADKKSILLNAAGELSGLAKVTATTFAGTATMASAVTFIPTGTRMLFQQSAAPTGWTKVTDSAYNDKALRLVTGDVVNKTDGKAFTTCMASGRGTANATQGGTIANATQGGSLSKTKAAGTIGAKTAGGSISKTTAGGTVGNKALSEAMLAKHRHSVTYANGEGTAQTLLSFINNRKSNPYYTSYIGSGSNHNHGFTGTEHGHTFTGTSHDHTFTGTEHTHTFTGSAHSHTFTGSAHSHTIDLDINYIDCIVAAKA